nr:reverse transcriptase domain-containing protein [Tanacetum cinerariifolium]
MRTRSSSNLVGESSPNPTTSNPKHHNRRHSKQPFILEESHVDTMADQRIMAELLRAPTEGYAEAIVVLPILVEYFELKHSLINMMTSYQFFGLEKDNPHDHIRWFNKITSTIKYKDVPNSAIKLMLFPFSLAGAARRWLKKEPPRSILTWEDLVSKFINEFFPISRTTNLQNEISNFQQRFDESFHEVWDRYKDLLRACPHHGFTELHQLDTFYNALNPTDQDSLNSAIGGNLLERFTQDVLTIIENKSKFRNSQNKLIVSQVKSSDGNSSSSSEIAKLTHVVNQQTSACLAVDGNTFLEFRDNIQGYVLAAVVNYNQAVILKKLPEKLRDPGKFLIPCGFSELKCKALADLANRVICTSAGIARDVFVLVGKFTFLTDFVIVDYESDPRVPLILGRPFLWTAHALIDVHGEEMILRDGDERLTLNMRHDTSSYSNQPYKESINMINIYNDSCEDYLEHLFAINHLRNGDIPFDIKSDLREIEYLFNHDPTKEMDSILEDSLDDCNLADLNNDLSDDDDVYDDTFYSKEDKIKEFKLLIDELDLARSSDFLSSPSLTNENLFEVTIQDCLDFEDSCLWFCPSITQSSHPQLHFGNSIS